MVSVLRVVSPPSSIVVTVLTPLPWLVRLLRPQWSSAQSTVVQVLTPLTSAAPQHRVGWYRAGAIAGGAGSDLLVTNNSANAAANSVANSTISQFSVNAVIAGGSGDTVRIANLSNGGVAGNWPDCCKLEYNYFSCKHLGCFNPLRPFPVDVYRWSGYGYRCCCCLV